MRLIFISLLLAVCFSSTVLAKQDDCLERFRNFEPIQAKVNPTNGNEDYDLVSSMAWYGECLLVGNTKGLWLYEIHQPEKPIMLAHVSERAITNVAVNPYNNTIAFSVGEEPTVYFINPDRAFSTWKSQGDVVTDISFSPDGSLMAVSSAKIMGRDTELWGLYYDSAIQILNTLQSVTASIPSSSDRTYVIVTKSIFSMDNQHLLTHDRREGYDGDNVTYWDLQTGKKVWDYNDLFINLKQWIPNIDPFYITNASMGNYIAALGGRAGVNNWDDYNGIAVLLWDVNTQQRLGYVVVSWDGSGHDEELLTDLTLNHDGSILVTAQNNGAVRFWNTSNDSEISKGIQEAAFVSQLQYNLSERYLSFLAGNKVVVWDVDTGEKISLFDPLKPC